MGEIRFVGTGETRGYPYLVCKNTCATRHSECCLRMPTSLQQTCSDRLRAAPFISTIIQVYAPTFRYDDSEVDHFYQQLQETIDQTPKKDILVVQGDWNVKVG